MGSSYKSRENGFKVSERNLIVTAETPLRPNGKVSNPSLPISSLINSCFSLHRLLVLRTNKGLQLRMAIETHYS